MPAWSKYASINDADLEQVDKIRQAVRGSDAEFEGRCGNAWRLVAQACSSTPGLPRVLAPEDPTLSLSRSRRCMEAISPSRPTGGHVLQTSGVSTPQANPGLPYLNQSPEPAATAGAAAPCSFPTAGNSTPQANEKFVTNEVVSSVPPVPPAIWADWNKDDTLLGVARCHM